MKKLVGVLEEAGYEDVRTYIQSGNVVLRSRRKPAGIGSLVERSFGFDPFVLVVSAETFARAADRNPFARAEGKAAHLYFCAAAPRLDAALVEQLRKPSEEYELSGRVFYLHAPEGIAGSRLAAQVERCLGVAATGRNLNTVRKLLELIART
jgi:uncharacterized protein (DUF1697 family)